MKHWLPTFALLISSLFAPVAVSAQPLVCNGPSGLVYVTVSSCATGNVGTFGGAPVGDCLVVDSLLELTFGACGGGGGGSNFPTGITTGIPGSNGPFAIVASAGGPVGFTTNNTTCLPAGNQVFGADLCINDNVNGFIFGIDSSGDVGIGSATGGPASFITNGGTFTGGNFISTVSPGYTDGTAGGASMRLGQAGAPTGTCASGSIYTRNDGTTLATTRYTCVSSGWIGG